MIIGNKIYLSKFDKNLITEKYLNWLNNPKVVRYSSQRFKLHTLDSSLEYLESFENSSNLFFSVRLNGSNEFIGTMNAYISDNDKTADIGILRGEVSQWGNGLGLDCWQTLMNFLLKEKHIRKVTGGTLSCNLGMISIMKSAGMELEAVKKKQQIIEGYECDELYFSIFNKYTNL